MHLSVRPAARWLGSALAIFLLVSLAVPTATFSQEADASSATTTAPLNIRSGPNISDPVVTVIPSGATVGVTGDAQNGFLPVSWNGSSGWSSADYLSLSGSTESGTGPVSGTAQTVAPLNFRSGPSTDYDVILVIPSGATVSLTGQQSGDFVSIDYSGNQGWVSSQFLTTTGSVPAPQSEPEPAPAVGAALTTAALHLRSGPGTENASLTIMPAGATVTVTGAAQNGWLPVTYNGTSGWSSAEFLTTGDAPVASAPQPSSEQPASSSMVTTASLNMRSGAGTEYGVITVIPAGSTVSVTGSGQNGFLPVLYGGSSGWASADYLRVNDGSTPSPAPAPATGGSGIVWPVSGGTWEIIQGYNGGTHQNRSATAQYYYALDFARTDGNTAGQPVYAPASGTVLWQDAGSGGMAIDMGNGYTIAMFHGTFDSGIGRGQSVSQGQYLGTVSGPGGAGYASTPHIDMTLWRTADGGRSAAPFNGGNAISGISFEDVGGSNQHAGTTFTP